VKRIEVLRWPQRTPFGMNTIGGAISAITQKPQFKFAGSAFVHAGSCDRFDRRSHPERSRRRRQTCSPRRLTQQVSARIWSQPRDGTSLRRRGQADCPHFGTLPAAQPLVSRSVCRLPARAPANRVLDTQDLKHSDVRHRPPKNQWAVSNGVARYDQRWISPSNFTNYSVFEPRDHEGIYGTSLTVSWLLKPAQLKSITAYRSAGIDAGLAFSGARSQIGDELARLHPEQSPHNCEPNLTLVNAWIAYSAGDDRWAVTANARNLTNHSYYLFREDTIHEHCNDL
jgi:hypothetical protein